MSKNLFERVVAKIAEAAGKTYKTIYVVSSRGRTDIMRVGRLYASSALVAAKTVLADNRTRVSREMRERGAGSSEIQGAMQFYSEYGRVLDEVDAGWASAGEDQGVFVVGPGSEWYDRVDDYKTWDKETHDKWEGFLNAKFETININEATHPMVSKMAEGETAGVHFVNLHFDGGHTSNDSMEELKLLGLHVYTDPLTEGSSDVGYIVSKTPITIEQVMKKYSPMLVDLTDEEKAEWLETHHLTEL